MNDLLRFFAVVASVQFFAVSAQTVATLSLVPLHPSPGSAFPEAVKDRSIFLTRNGTYLLSYRPSGLSNQVGSSGRVEVPIVFPSELTATIKTAVTVSANNSYDYTLTVRNRESSRNRLSSVRIPVLSPQASSLITLQSNSSGWSGRFEKDPTTSFGLVWRSASGLAPGGEEAFVARSNLLPGLQVVELAGKLIVDEQVLAQAPGNVMVELNRLSAAGLGRRSMTAVVPRFHPATHPFAVAADFVEQLTIATLMGDIPPDSAYANELKSELKRYIYEVQRTKIELLEDVHLQPSIILKNEPVSAMEKALSLAVKVSLMKLQ